MKQFFYTTIRCLILLVLTSKEGYAQMDSGFHFFSKYNYNIVSFTVSNIGEFYFINKDNQLKKFNEKGDSVGVFNEVTKYGQLSFVEADNPWRTILYYKNFSTIVLLDKYLKVLTSINLRKMNIFRVKAVSASYDNNTWVFDEQESKLRKINDDGKVLMETVDLRTIFDSVPSPEQIIDRDGFVYLYDPLKGLYIFDYYGTFKNRLTFLHWKYVSVMGKFIYGFDDNYLFSYNIGSLNLIQYPLPSNFKDYTSLKISNNKIYLLKNNQLEVFTLR